MVTMLANLTRLRPAIYISHVRSSFSSQVPQGWLSPVHTLETLGPCARIDVDPAPTIVVCATLQNHDDNMFHSDVELQAWERLQGMPKKIDLSHGARPRNGQKGVGWE